MRTKNKEGNKYVEEAPLIQLVSQLLLKAHEMGASDLHLEPLETIFRIRFRIDGILQEIQQLPKKLERPLISRLKIMTSSMNIAEKRLPQDGRFHFHSGETSLDIRAATMPTLHGESMVLRVLNPTSHLLNLSQLGLESRDQGILKKLLHQPDGLILITGPTGSGKTTTLYGCLKELQHSSYKIITVEDPIEYRLHGINQVQTKEEIGLTFARVLRAILRQAPNKIIVGEIRDPETAQIAMNASLTGHLILSTLHANDAPSAIARLVDMKIAPFVIASGLRAIIAQRLVRKLCPHCKEPTTLSEYEKKALQLGGKDFSARLPSKLTETAAGSTHEKTSETERVNLSSKATQQFAASIEFQKKSVMRAKGCSRCHGKGFRGRLGIFEVLVLDEKIRHLIHHQAPTSELRNYARKHGMCSLHEDGFRKIEAGLTSAHEVISSALIEMELRAFEKLL